MRRWFPHPWGWASLAPLLCAVHCAAAPILVVAAPALAAGTWLEVALLVLTVPLAAWALSAGLVRHRQKAPALAAGIGLLAWTGSLAGVYGGVPEEASTLLAALVVTGALVWNARLDCGAGRSESGGCAKCEAGEGLPGADRFPVLERPPVAARRVPSNL